MLKEKYTLGDNVAIVTKDETNEYNPYTVKIEIHYADYESCRTLIEQLGISPFKKIINE